MTPLQCKMARSGLNLSNAELAGMAKVGVNTVSRFEQGGDVRQSSVAAMRAALEKVGAEFVQEDQPSLGGGFGVRIAG